MASRGGISSSTPPRGAKRDRMALAKFWAGGRSSSTAVLRMSLTSCSMDLPCAAAAAWMRSFCLTHSSRFRTVMLANVTPCLDYSLSQCDCNAINTFRQHLAGESASCFRRPITPACPSASLAASPAARLCTLRGRVRLRGR